jgi:hypothetical protein
VPDAAGATLPIDIGPDDWQEGSSYGIEDGARKTGVHLLLDLPAEEDYPAAAWEPDEVADDPQADSWITAPLAGPAE